MLYRSVGKVVARIGVISVVALLTVSGCTGSPNPGEDPSPLDPITNGLIVNGLVDVTTDPNEPNQPTSYTTDQYEFDVNPVSGSRPLTVTCAVSTITGDPLASGTYTWKFDGVEESGPMAEYAQRSHVFRTGGAHTVALAVSLLGVSAPISCTSKQTRTTQCVVVVAPRVSGHVLGASGEGIAGVVVAGNSGAGTAVSAADGSYQIEVPYDWSGQIGPQSSTLVFQQATRSYTSAKEDIADQDFSVAAAAKLKLAGSIRDGSGNPLPGVALAADNGGETATTGSDGSYQFELTSGWSGKITPTLKDYAFTPSDRSYSNLTADAQSQDFAGASTAPATVKIAGYVKDSDSTAISGVNVVASNGGPTATTDANGRYELTVAYHWNGTITPNSDSYTFLPSSRPYADATADLSSEDFTATPVLLVFPKVSGYVKDAQDHPIQGVMLTATSSEAKATTDANGFYEMTMTINWSGKITPALGEYGFEPGYMEYTSLSTNLTQQNYKAMAPAPAGSWTISGACKDALGTGLVGIVLTASSGETASSGPDGAYSLTLSEGWSGTITPGNGDASCTFGPPNRTYNPLASDQADQDFVIMSDSKTGTASWQNFALPAAQTGTFTVEFDAIANEPNIDGVIGLSSKEVAAWTDQALTIRFNSSNRIDVRDGAVVDPNYNYRADVVFPYVPATLYHFRVLVRVPAHTYDVYVRKGGDSEQSLAKDYAFRPVFNTITLLNRWSLLCSVGSHQVGNFRVKYITASETAPLTMAFTAMEGSGSLDPNHLPTGAVLKWNFGDGGTNAVVTGSASEKGQVTHAYTQAGTYTVALSIVVGSLETSCCLLPITIAVVPSDRVATPSIQPDAATYDAGTDTYLNTVRVRITGDPNSTIRYTTNGLEPTADSTRYTDPNGFVLNGTTTVKAKAFKSGVTDSDTASKSLTVKSNSLSQYDITWTFDKAYIVGHFVNGDWWVMGPATVQSVSPAPTGSGSTYRNGSMVNPCGGQHQGYDGRADFYNASYSVSYPSTLQAGQSLVSTQSRPENDSSRVNVVNSTVALSRVKLWKASVLTCLGSVPSPTAFRPPLAGTEKPLYDSVNLRTSLLPSLTAPSGNFYNDISNPLQSGQTRCAQFARYFERPWLFHMNGSSSEGIAPLDNSVGYYSCSFMIESEAALLLCCNLPDRNLLLCNFVQYGIDVYYAAKSYSAQDTVRNDRRISKWPMLLAGLMLNDNALVTPPSYTIMKTDAYTYYGNGWNGAKALWTYNDNITPPADWLKYEEHSPFETGSPCSYWCMSYSLQGQCGTDTPFWKCESYRRMTHSWNWVGTALAARLMGAMGIWNHPAFFDYCDRWMTEDESGYWTTFRTLGQGNPCGDGAQDPGYIEGTIPISTFTTNMWKSYR